MVGPRRAIVNTNVEKRTIIMFNERLRINRPKSPNYNQSPPSRYISLPTSSMHIYLSMRSEEHTSELQSRQYLVCRLLLEKKKPSTLHNHDSRTIIESRVS